MTRIRVEKLFGLYSYDLRVPDNTSGADEQQSLGILYGDNGSGKTTILNLLFHLLSPAKDRGHKTAMLRIPFRRFEVTLGRDLVIGADRPSRQALLNTSLHFYIRLGGRRVYSILGKVDKQTHFVGPVLEGFLSRLQRLNLTLFYITDDRDLLSDEIVRKGEEEEAEAVETVTIRSSTPSEMYRQHMIRRQRPEGRRIDTALSTAMKYAVEWAQERVLKGSKQGESDANTIYMQIVNRLTTIPSLKRRREAPTADDLIEVLVQQAKRSAEFAKYGLPSAANIEELVAALRSSHRNREAVVTVLQPHVDSVRARLDALQEVQQSIATFVDTVNTFLLDKTVSFDLTTGITVRGRVGTLLEPSALSSGEKQLLLLFCNTLIARSQTTIVLIDEPELSLNIKWQRRLIASLAAPTGSRSIQYILATHSFELLAPHAEHVWQLNSAGDERPDPSVS